MAQLLQVIQGILGGLTLGFPCGLLLYFYLGLLSQVVGQLVFGNMKKEFIGWVPKEETPEETLSWVMEDPSLVMHKTKESAVKQWGQNVKEIKVVVDIDEITEQVIVAQPPAEPPVTPVAPAPAPKRIHIPRKPMRFNSRRRKKINKSPSNEI